MFRPGIGHSQTHNNCKNALWGNIFYSLCLLVQASAQNYNKRLLGSSCPAILPQGPWPHWTVLHEISYLNIFRKSVEKFQISLPPDKNNGYFTWRHMHTYESTLLNLLKPTGYVMHQQFNIQQLYALSTPYLCVLYLSENKQRLVPLTA